MRESYDFFIGNKSKVGFAFYIYYNAHFYIKYRVKYLYRRKRYDQRIGNNKLSKLEKS